MRWTPEWDWMLSRYYPIKGKDWCVEHMGLSEGQVRSRAATLRLKAQGVSEAWHANNDAHSVRMTGRSRPEHSATMRRLFGAGRILRPLTPEQRKKQGERLSALWAERGHPRGATGMKHTAETRRVIGEKSAARWAATTEDQRAARTMKIMKTRAANDAYSPQRIGTTWKSGWREIGGVRKYYRSRWEANYARYLEWLRLRGEIAAWSHEPEVFWFDGIKRGCVSYLPDFRVVENGGRVVFHEVKGWMDDRSKTKIRRMAKYHPAVVLIVIQAKQYDEIKRKLSALIAEWE